MSDPLGEALANYDLYVKGRGTVDRIDLDPIAAAARNWHALTNPTDELIERLATRLVPWLDVPTANHKAAVVAALDALTVTAGPE